MRNQTEQLDVPHGVGCWGNRLGGNSVPVQSYQSHKLYIKPHTWCNLVWENRLILHGKYLTLYTIFKHHIMCFIQDCRFCMGPVKNTLPIPVWMFAMSVHQRLPVGLTTQTPQTHAQEKATSQRWKKHIKHRKNGNFTIQWQKFAHKWHTLQFIHHTYVDPFFIFLRNLAQSIPMSNV